MGANHVCIEDIDDDSDPDILGAALNADQVVWWENSPTAIDEGKRMPIDFDNAIPTIINGPLPVTGGDYKIFDIAGRQITSLSPKPGIYFIEIQGGYSHKIIKVK
jgi:hypothetical protein